MLDSDLAELYQVPTKALNQAVRRNIARFPKDFMIQLTLEDAAKMRAAADEPSSGTSRSQIVTLKQGANVKHRPFVFTEQGVAMLSSVLKSTRAVRVNIAIMRAFVQVRQVSATHNELLRRVNEMEQKHDGHFHTVFAELRKLMEPPPSNRKRIGFPSATR